MIYVINIIISWKYYKEDSSDKYAEIILNQEIDDQNFHVFFFLTILKWAVLAIYSFSSGLQKLLFLTTMFWIDYWRFMIVQVSSCLLRWFEKNIFSFIIQSRHFIVVRFHQKRIPWKEMDWELCISKISTIFKKHSKFLIISETQLKTRYDQIIIQSISPKEWYYVSMIYVMMGVGDLFAST